MSSQLPNIKGRVTGLLGHAGPETTGLMNYTKRGGYYGWSHGSAFETHFDFDANKANPIYKDGDGLTPFGESFSMNTWIKAKLF